MSVPKGVLSILGDVKIAHECNELANEMATILEDQNNKHMVVEEMVKMDAVMLPVPEKQSTSADLKLDAAIKEIPLGLDNPKKSTFIGEELTPK